MKIIPVENVSRSSTRSKMVVRQVSDASRGLSAKRIRDIIPSCYRNSEIISFDRIDTLTAQECRYRVVVCDEWSGKVVLTVIRHVGKR